MGEKNKLLQKIDEEVMIRTVTKEALKSKADDVIIITGHDQKNIIKSLENLPIKFVNNSNYINGIGNSISSGVYSLSIKTDGVIILLGDMPRIKYQHIDILIDSFIPTDNKAICALESDGKQGNPILFGKFFFDQLKALSNDYGGKDIIQNNLDYLIINSIDDNSIFFDIDTPIEIDNLIRNKSKD
ncbi:MAG: hypothetical protein CMM49_01240 [Rhodospirillaceae bacterium]|nr:hypothetical protein [Rhodospirillaceae bacterium]|tara:strand:- start:7107 stop:7664 length:558 start_codon:yes stop_codon:yes gene_type:complete